MNFFLIATTVVSRAKIEAINAAVPAGYVVNQFVRNGFLLVAVAVVIFLAFKYDNGPRSILRRNKSRNSRPTRSNTNELGSGDLAVKEQILPWLTKKNPLDTLLPVKNIKGGDGIACRQGNLVIPQEERNRHILVIAKTGSGKTTRAILPVLFNDCLCPTRSTIVVDSKPEMWDKLVGLTRKYNPEKKILLFNPLDTVRSLSWNILGKIETDTDAKLIANTLISATDNPMSRSDSPFFRNNALALLNSIMVGLLNDPNDTLSMPRVHELINMGMEPLCKWIEAHPQAIRNSKTFVDLARSGSQNADTIMSELGMRLAAWDLVSIRATTSNMELDLESLIAEPTLFIVELRESELEMLRPMANVIVVELLRYLTKRAEQMPGQRLPRPVGIVIDEFASALGRLPDIHVKLNTLRSRNVSIVAAIQSIAQIKANYDRDADSVIAGFSSKILMPNLDFQDSEWASKETGTMTVRFNVSSIGRNKRIIDYFATKNDNVQEQVQQRPVLTPDEIGRPADNAATFFLPNTPVFQGHLVPYFEVPETMEKFNATKNFDFKMRELPISYEERLPEAFVTQPTMSSEELSAGIANARAALQVDSASETAQQWWAALEEMNKGNPASVLSLAEQLLKRAMSLEELYNVFAASGVQSVEELLKVVDQSKLAAVREQLNYETANQHARDWWLAFEEANRDNISVIVELCGELNARGMGIEEFFGVYVHSEAKSVPELLALIDRLIEEKRSSESQPAIEHNTPVEISTENTPVTEAAPIVEATQTQESPAEPTPYMNGNGAINHAEAIAANGSLNGTDHSAPLAEKVEVSTNTFMTPKEERRLAALQVKLEGYLEMGAELLAQGKTSEYQQLLELIRAENELPPELLAELQALGASA